MGGGRSIEVLPAPHGHPMIQTADDSHQAFLSQTRICDCLERGWRVVLWCRSCGYDTGCDASLGLDRMMTMPPTMTLQDLADRASFPCGNRGAWIDTRSGAQAPVTWMDPRKRL